MNARTALGAYKTTRTSTAIEDASPHQLITMLIDGALEKVATAGGAMGRGELASSGEAIGKAISIIAYLKSILDESAAPEFTGNLWNLYSYMESTLLSANISNDEEKLREVVELLNEVRAGWGEMIKAGARG